MTLYFGMFSYRIIEIRILHTKENRKSKIISGKET